MPTRIGLISDTHSTLAPLREALDIFARQQVDMIICAGDIAGYGDDELEQTIELLKQSKCNMIAGNHDLPSELDMQPEHVVAFLQSLPLFLRFDIEDTEIYVVHAEPPCSQHDGIKLLDPDGNPISERCSYWAAQLSKFKYDILIVGHTHQVFAEQLGDTLVINPGSTKYNHTCMILELPSRSVQLYALSGKQPILTWNWGKFFQEQNHDA